MYVDFHLRINVVSGLFRSHPGRGPFARTFLRQPGALKKQDDEAGPQPGTTALPPHPCSPGMILRWTRQRRGDTIRARQTRPVILQRIEHTLAFRLALFHIGIIALANWTVQFTGTFLGYHFTWAMFVFPVVILATDLTVRLSGQRMARRIVGYAYLPAILISILLADWRIGLASGTAYLVGQLVDITVFQKIRERVRAWWAAPAISTVFANIIDTYVFYSAAFVRSGDPFMAANWLEVATVDLAFKIVVSLLVFLPAYGVILSMLQRRFALD